MNCRLEGRGVMLCWELEPSVSPSSPDRMESTENTPGERRSTSNICGDAACLEDAATEKKKQLKKIISSKTNLLGPARRFDNLHVVVYCPALLSDRTWSHYSYTDTSRVVSQPKLHHSKHTPQCSVQVLSKMVVAFSSLVRTWGECTIIHSLPALFFFFF